MILQQLARDKSIPEDLSILKKLRESVTRFEKFQREYSDYKRYREKVLKSTSVSLVETRFTC
jgi:antitoxin component of RelBE/YafQ-DinJ toxin-antitoxin module